MWGGYNWFMWNSFSLVMLYLTSPPTTTSSLPCIAMPHKSYTLAGYSISKLESFRSGKERVGFFICVLITCQQLVVCTSLLVVYTLPPGDANVMSSTGGIHVVYWWCSRHMFLVYTSPAADAYVTFWWCTRHLLVVCTSSSGDVYVTCCCCTRLKIAMKPAYRKTPCPQQVQHQRNVWAQ